MLPIFQESSLVSAFKLLKRSFPLEFAQSSMHILSTNGLSYMRITTQIPFAGLLT